MQFFAHAGAGWILAQFESSRRDVRLATVIAAVASDIDVISHIFGEETYIAYHHLLTHGLVFSLLVSAVSVWFCKGARLKTLLLTQLAFYTHFFGDYYLSGWDQTYFFPFSDAKYVASDSLDISHPINHALSYGAFASVIVIGFLKKRTPIEFVWPKLEQRIINLLFSAKRDPCHLCGKKCNEKCSVCGKPVCVKHTVLKSMQPVCSECDNLRKTEPPSETPNRDDKLPAS